MAADVFRGDLSPFHQLLRDAVVVGLEQQRLLGEQVEPRIPDMCPQCLSLLDPQHHEGGGHSEESGFLLLPSPDSLMGDLNQLFQRGGAKGGLLTKARQHLSNGGLRGDITTAVTAQPVGHHKAPSGSRLLDAPVVLILFPSPDLAEGMMLDARHQGFCFLGS